MAENFAERLIDLRCLCLTSQPLAKLRFDHAESRFHIARYTDISKYELNKNEPPLAVLLAYSRAANVSLERIIDSSCRIDVCTVNHGFELFIVQSQFKL